MFMALLRAEDLADPSWVLELDEFDEPPLFTRYHQIEFLRRIPEEERCIAALEIVLSMIEEIAKEAMLGAPHRTFFVCANFSNFDSWRCGEQPIPTPAIFVNPDEDAMPRSAVPFVEPYSPEGKAVARWLVQLGAPFAERFVVGELPPMSFDPDLQRVYVGWRTDPFGNVISVGSDMSTAKPPDADP